MCSVIGAFNVKDAFLLVQKGLEIMKERGRDGCGYYDGSVYAAKEPSALPHSSSSHILGHGLHAIVNNVPQPIKHGDGVLVANCEIYNWKDLEKTYKIKAQNDADLLLKLFNKVGVEKALSVLRGVYAVAYWQGETLYLARDILGVKPLWYHHEKSTLLFSSEKKALPGKQAEELNPRKIVKYGIKSGKVSFINRKFFALSPEVTGNRAQEKLKKIFLDAVKIRIPERKFGLLFSGGLDSLLIAKVLKDLGQDFTCYTAATSEDAPDLIAAKDAAKKLHLKLKYKVISKEQTRSYLQKVVPLIEDNNVIKVGVALPLYIASELAKADGNKVIFSGSGADELFGGYHRYKTTELGKLNKDCYSDVLKIYERNTYRDDVITMNNNLELRVPFLDKKLVAFALRMDPAMKIHNGIEKYALRQLAQTMSIPAFLAQRKKKAAQYGSGFDKAIEKLAKGEKKSKSKYLEQFYATKNLRLGALVSGGKDSLFAAYIMKLQNYDISCLISMRSKNPSSYMFHTPNIHLVELQAKAIEIPLVLQETHGEKEAELKDLEKALKTAKQKYHIEGVISGALYSNYQRERIEKVADKLALKIFSPLWHLDQEMEMWDMLHRGFEIILSSVAADGLDKSWLGRTITEKDIHALVILHKKYGVNIAGEGGEFESLVLDCPLFKKKIKILQSEIIEENVHTAQIRIKKAVLETK